jgi:hypothetical protein
MSIDFRFCETGLLFRSFPPEWRPELILCYSTSKDVSICLGSTINVQVALNMTGYLWQLDTQEHLER